MTGEALKEALYKDYNEALDYAGVSGKRLAERLAALSKIGTTADGGVYRIGFSQEEMQAKTLVKQWMTNAGLTVYDDSAGNVFGKLEGSDPTLPTVMSGSHVDSVPNGGHFDGPLGVLCALEVVEAWREQGYKPRHSYEVAIFTDEEGGRFNGGILGSQAMVGDLTDKMKELTDREGQSFEQVLSAVGLTPDGFLNVKRDLTQLKSYVEVHIEQGKRLEKEQLPVGIVTGIAGPCWIDVTFTGKAGHAGNTPMNDRYDALLAASDWIQSVNSLPQKVSSTAVATVGRLDVSPNAANIIPGQVQMTADIRDIHEETRDELVGLAIEEARRVAEKYGVDMTSKEQHRITPIPIQEKEITHLKEAFEAHGVRPYLLPSGAGHDAMILGRYIPSAMIFVQSKAGISHTPEEWSALNDCVMAVHVLKSYVEKLVEKD